MVKLTWTGEFPTKKQKGKHFKRAVKKIKPIYDYFANRIDQLNTKEEIQKWVEAVAYLCYFVVIRISADFEAFEIFERMNARGIELNAAELLKNHLFSKKGDLKEDELNSKWSEIFENSNNDLLRMLRYFYISGSGFVRKDELYKKLQEKVRESGTKEFIEELDQYSQHYYNFLVAGRKELEEYFKETIGGKLGLKAYDLDEMGDAIEGLRLFKVYQPFTILCSAYGKILKDTNNLDSSFKAFKKLLLSLEKFHFINNAICKKANNEIEHFYADMCTKITNDQNLSMSRVDKIIEGLRQRKESIEVFVDGFVGITYEENDRAAFRMIYYLFDKFNNHKKKGGERISIYDTDQRLIRKNYNIDHMNPRKSKEYDISSDDVRETIDNIGNLMVIPYHTNSRAQNVPLANKIKEFYQQYANNLPMVQEFIGDFHAEDWNSQDAIFNAIDKRADALAKRAYREIWAF